MGEGRIQRLFLFLIFTVITVVIQYLIIKVFIKDSTRKQISLNVFITLLWYVLAIYSTYKQYPNLFFYSIMGLLLFFIINSVFSIRGNYYDSRKIRPKYKIIIAIIGFAFIGLSLLKVVEIYSVLTIIAILLLASYFIDYKNYNAHYEN